MTTISVTDTDAVILRELLDAKLTDLRREISHTDLGRKLLIRFAADLTQYGAVEGQPRLEGRNAHVMISPVKVIPPAKEKPEKPKAPPAAAAPSGADPA